MYTRSVVWRCGVRPLFKSDSVFMIIRLNVTYQSTLFSPFSASMIILMMIAIHNFCLTESVGKSWSCLQSHLLLTSI